MNPAVYHILQRFLRVRVAVHMVPPPFQALAQIFHHALLVVDQGDGNLLDLLPLLRLTLNLNRADADGHRQVNVETASLPGLALRAHSPTVVDQNVLDHGQPQPGALASLLGGEKRVENLVQDLLAHAAARVAHRDLHIIPVRHLPAVFRQLLPADTPGFHRQQAAVLLHGLTGVGVEV